MHWRPRSPRARRRVRQRSMERPDCHRRWPLAVVSILLTWSMNLLPAAVSAAPLRFSDALDAARRHNPELLAARQRAEIARGRLVRAHYWNKFNPRLEGGTVSRQFAGGGSEVQRSAGISIELEVAGQRGKRIEAAQRDLERVEAEIADAERLVLSRVKDAFYRILYLDRRRKLFHELESLNRRLSDASAERFRSGEVPKLEANLGVVRLSRSRRETLSAERDYDNAVRELEQLLGRETVGGIALAGDLSPHPTGASLERLLQSAVRVRPDLRAREAEIHRIEAETGLAERSIVPNPTLAGSYDEEVESAGRRDRIIGGRISIPIPVFDRNQGEAHAACRRARPGLL